MIVSLILALLVFATPQSPTAIGCGIVLTHAGAESVDVYDPLGDWLTFDAIAGTVDLTIDGVNGTELAPGDYVAVWDDETREPFTLTCSEEEPALVLDTGSEGTSVLTSPTPALSAVYASEAPDAHSTVIGTALVGGTATWYCGHGSACTRGYGPLDMVAAIDPTLGIAKGERVRVTHDGKTVTVQIVDVCACAGARVIDLTSGAFLRLAPTDRGVIPVEVETLGSIQLPETDTVP